MRKLKQIALVVLILGTLAITATATPQTSPHASMAVATDGAQEKKSLYLRLGGYDAIAAVVDDFIGRLVADNRFTKFFVGHSEDSLKKIRMHVIDQLCAAAGGPCLYIGRDMKASHHGLGITGADWDESAKHLVESLDKFKVGKQEKDDVMAFVGTLRKDIVDK